MKLKKAAALFIASSLAASCVGCVKDKNKSADMNFGESYPLKTNETLSCWMAINQNVTASVATFAETPYAKALEKMTGVHIEYQHPSIGAEAEQFNLLIAGGELPDIIEHGWYEFPGGPGKAIDDGYIISLNDYLGEYAPNLSKYLKENPKIDKMVQTDDGRYYLFPFIRNDERLLLTAGPIVRQDLLESLGIEKPVTYDDWYNMLTAFKAAGVEIPLAFNATDLNEIDSLLGCFGAESSYYVEDGKIHFGPLDESFKETLMMLSKWYQEGLLDKNFTTTDSKIRESNVLLGKVGVTYASGGSHLGKWIKVLGADSEIKLTSLPYPKKNASDKGARYKSLSQNFPGSGAAVTSSCKSPALAVKYLDFLYSEEGNRLANFGIEGESYKMIDGCPTYTEEITDNPDGLSMSQAMAKYMRSYSSGPFVQSVEYIEQYYALDVQKKALLDWCESNEYTQKYMMPRILCTAQEAEEMAEITNNINTYRDNMVLKFITGIESFENYDAFISRMKAFGIDRAIRIQQTAYERYIKR